MTDVQNIAFEAAKLIRKRARMEWKNAKDAPGTFSSHGHESVARACDSMAWQVLQKCFSEAELPAVLRQVDDELARGD